MNISRSLHGTIKSYHKIYAFGSAGGNKSAERYDLIKNSWKNLPDMPHEGSCISLVRL